MKFPFRYNTIVIVETRDLRIAIPCFHLKAVFVKFVVKIQRPNLVLVQRAILKELQIKCELRGSWLD